MSTNTIPASFDILFYRDADAVVAHCLETDTIARADNVPAATDAIRHALADALDGGDLAAAPDAVWERVCETVGLSFVRLQIDAKALPKEHRRIRAVFYFLKGVIPGGLRGAWSRPAAKAEAASKTVGRRPTAR